MIKSNKHNWKRKEFIDTGRTYFECSKCHATKLWGEPRTGICKGKKR